MANELNRPLIFGHRGMGAGPNENTMEAFQEAFDLGVDGVELDIYRTKDGKLVVHHHSEFEKPDKTFGFIFDLNWDEVHKALPHVPTLDDVIERFKGHGRLMIEIKREDPQTARDLLEAIHRQAIESQVEVTSYMHSIIYLINQLDPTIRKAVIFPPFPDFYQRRQLEVAILDAAKVTGAQVVHLKNNYLDEDLLRLLHHHDIEVNGNGDNREDILMLQEIGVDQFTSNDPKLAVELLKTKP